MQTHRTQGDEWYGQKRVLQVQKKKQYTCCHSDFTQLTPMVWSVLLAILIETLETTGSDTGEGLIGHEVS